jgi:hypothetical protein
MLASVGIRGPVQETGRWRHVGDWSAARRGLVGGLAGGPPVVATRYGPLVGGDVGDRVEDWSVATTGDELVGRRGLRSVHPLGGDVGDWSAAMSGTGRRIGSVHPCGDVGGLHGGGDVRGPVDRLVYVRTGRRDVGGLVGDWSVHLRWRRCGTGRRRCRGTVGDRWRCWGTTGHGDVGGDWSWAHENAQRQLTTFLSR